MKRMTYKETTEYLFNQMPMFERQGASGYKEGLHNTLVLDSHFGHPHRNYATIHVGGTNGKGSVSHTLAAYLQACGYRVGLYTSPHLCDFRERIRVNGQPISEEAVVEFVEQERGFFEPLAPSFFEVTTALAFKYFSDERVDVAVIEVGLGGRLDCTNIITPLLSVITNISFDHTQFLGSTLPLIASEKAGIIKKGVPVVVGESHQQTRPVFEAKAREMDAPITFADDAPEVLRAEVTDGGMLYTTRHYGEMRGDLGGTYQAKNANTALVAIDAIIRGGRLACCSAEKAGEDIAKAVGNVTGATGLMGRWQTVGTHPTVVCDIGHNVGGWEYLSRQLALVKCRQMHVVFGMVNDKDADGVLALLPKDAIYYFTRPSTKRAIPEQELFAKARACGLHGCSFPTVEEACRAAMAAALPADFVFIGGSNYVVADYMTLK